MSGASKKYMCLEQPFRVALFSFMGENEENMESVHMGDIDMCILTKKRLEK